MRAPARGTLWLRVVAGFALLASLVVNFGVIDLITAVAPSPEWEPVRMLEAGWGIVFGILLPIGFAAQFRRGGGPVATVQQLVVVTASLALATLLTLKAHEWLLVLFWAAMTAAIIALHPARSQVFALPRRADPVLAGTAALGLLPAAVYAAQMAANHRAGLIGDDTNGFEHWTVQAALPIALVLLVALSALKTDGWRIPAASAAISAALLGALAIADDGSLGDFATAWGIATLAWSALIFAALARTSQRPTLGEPLGEAAIVEPGPPTNTRGSPTRLLGTEGRRSRRPRSRWPRRPPPAAPTEHHPTRVPYARAAPRVPMDATRPR